MKLFTLIENQKKLEKAEVEIQMIPGIPQIHFLGLPDQAIKESFLRIKSALKLCQYKFPTNQQIIVNIKPNHLKKTSKGLELAVALGILHITQQKILSESILKSIIYGELGLNGEVSEPPDLIDYKTTEKILSGQDIFQHNQIQFRISKLSEDIEYIQNIKVPEMIRPTEGLQLTFTADEAEILFLFSTTQMHLLLSGPAGLGKTTLAQHTPSFSKTPLPLIAPHSSTTLGAFLGGGAQLFQGEIEKIKNGILFLDELLEFDPEIIETLRGPMTGQKLRLSRAGNTREFDCDFQVVATSNLCPCGKWTPEIKIRNCRFSNKRCQAHLERISGPILDRFGLYYYYPQKIQKRTIFGYEILKRIENFARKKKDLTPNNHLEPLLEQMYTDLSLRRKNSLLKVAQVYAIERESSTVELQDLTRAEKWTYGSFLELEQGMS